MVALSKRNRDRKNSRNAIASKSLGPLYAAIAVVMVIAVAAGLYLTHATNSTTTLGTSFLTGTSTTTISNSAKSVILYVNQGNAFVSRSNFSSLLSFAKSNQFNTIFFQVYRSGSLLFSQSDLQFLVTSAHVENLKIYFALYFTSPSQQIPSSIYSLGEDGINLDMSTLSPSDQANLLSTLSQNYHSGRTSVTSLDFQTTLKPDQLILETYSTADQQYIHPGIIASVEPLAIPNAQEYNSQFQYALKNSDGVMVFDYYGLLKTGY